MLENENLIKGLTDNSENPYQNRYKDRRILQKVENDVINKIFKYFSELLLDIYVNLGNKIPCSAFNECELMISLNIGIKNIIKKAIVNF